MTAHSAKVAAAREFVRLGFGDAIDDNAAFRSLHFLTDTLTTDEVVEVIPLLSSFNQFDGLKVAEAIKQFRGKVSGWQFGAANSPLIVVVLAAWTHQLEFVAPNDYDGRRFSHDEQIHLASELQAIFTDKLGAHSFEPHPNSSLKYSAWWD